MLPPTTFYPLYFRHACGPNGLDSTQWQGLQPMDWNFDHFWDKVFAWFAKTVAVA
jgi:hypothetical protein